MIEHLLHLPLGTMFFTYTFMAATVVSGVVGAVATYRQGKEAQRVSELNADLANQEARQQLAIGRMQEQISMQQAAAERSAMMAEAAAANANASAIDQETLANEARSREEQRRAREEARQRLAETEASSPEQAWSAQLGHPSQCWLSLPCWRRRTSSTSSISPTWRAPSPDGKLELSERTQDGSPEQRTCSMPSPRMPRRFLVWQRRSVPVTG